MEHQGTNPSTADATVDDPTVRRMVGYAQGWGYGGLKVANLFAFRATRPSLMMSAADPVGPDNDMHIARLATTADLVLGAWGNDGSFMGRDGAARRVVPRMKCLKLTKQGQPAHPLYLRQDLVPIEF